MRRQWVLWGFMFGYLCVYSYQPQLARTLRPSILKTSPRVLFSDHPGRPDTFGELREVLSSTGVNDENINIILTSLRGAGVSSTNEMVAISRDFAAAPIDLSEMIKRDFEVKGLLAHQLRTALMVIMTQPVPGGADNTLLSSAASTAANTAVEERLVPYDQYRVQSKRKGKDRSYGLKQDDIPPQLRAELSDFMVYMTERSPLSQEAPIRWSTAEVYFRHATLFCGWWLSTYDANANSCVPREEVTLRHIFPTKERAGAASLYAFVKWLKQERGISDSYEANMLRGISKLAKFRFSGESTSDPSYGEKSFEDIHVVREIRKLHRDANRRQKLAPRVSDEDKKWLSWPEYLEVVQKSKSCLEGGMSAYSRALAERSNRGLGIAQIDLPASVKAKQRKIAQLYQRYLVLALFATVPDRQRTFRELELDRTLLREADGWVIKHGPDDYKTGKSYGDRPPLQVSPALTEPIDTFIAEWRCHFNPKSKHLFVQPRTGKPFTGDSVYDRVARACYEYTGKKTNPHLLRDSVVTHVRGTNASEKELEALALFMGHSINMQRSSYDRRSLKQKVSPAVDLLQHISPLGK